LRFSIPYSPRRGTGTEKKAKEDSSHRASLRVAKEEKKEREVEGGTTASTTLVGKEERRRKKRGNLLVTAGEEGGTTVSLRRDLLRRERGRRRGMHTWGKETSGSSASKRRGWGHRSRVSSCFNFESKREKRRGRKSTFLPAEEKE